MRRLAVATAFLLVSAAAAPSWAATTAPSKAAATPHASAQQAATKPATTQPAADQQANSKYPVTPPDDLTIPNAVDTMALNDAQNFLAKASSVITRFNNDPKMLGLMRQAKAIFVIPEFGHATNVPGGHWGAAVLLANSNGHWSAPAIFSLGGGSLGAQTTANGGAVLLFIMNDRALAKFRGANWTLNSAPGTMIVTYSAATPQDLSGSGADIVSWSAAGSAKSDIQLSINDISFDTASNQAVYGTADIRNILANHTPYTNQTVIRMVQQMPRPAVAAPPTANASVQSKTPGHG